MTIDNIDFEDREVTRKYVTIDGEDFRAARLLDLLQAVKGTDGFIGGVRCTGSDWDLAELLMDKELLGKSHAAGYYEKDAEAVEELLEAVRDAY